MRRAEWWIALSCLAACGDAPSTGPHAQAADDARASGDARAFDDATRPHGDATPGPPDDAGGPLDAAIEADATPIAMDAATVADASLADAATSTTPAIDLDRDGLDDSEEDRIAREYLPFLALDPNDRCPRMATLFRLRPHPQASHRLLLVIVNLFENDCGASGHVGDNEVSSLTIDPARPAPDGILALRAIAHQATACEEVGTCGRCAPLAACATAIRRGAAYPVVFFSTGKHGSYVSEDACDRSCFFTNFCQPASVPTEPPLFNAGEPNAPLIRDLTAAGAITSTAGWTETSLFGFDPWGPDAFGRAGTVSEDLVDPAFVTPACP